ncbi:MAG TPA: VTT domain-containing protein, partial [Candidatus Binatia bacterium]
MSPSPICVEGKNCWRIERANRAAFLIDGEAYFSALASAFKRARHFIFIKGWQLDSRFRLFPADVACPIFGDFLHDLVHRNRQLHIYVLLWDFAMIYSGDREIIPLYAHPWRTHRRIHFLLDGSHPLGASHHQKIVVVDDAVGFAGGFDIADRRWDTPSHIAEDPRRMDAYNRPYPPSHDVQLMVDGDAAAALGELVKERWHRATGRRFHTPSGPVGDPWPIGFGPDLTDISVAISRTEPRCNDRPEVREVEQLYLDSIRAARRVIYVENQYLSSKSIGEALAARLEEENGPEVVMVLPQETSEWLEQMTMAVLRSRLLQRLRTADRFKRLHVYYPVVPGANVQIRVHAKVFIVDDQLARIGSSNLNNRSMGLDTECDLSIEAHNISTEQSIINLRHRLAAEHLGVTPEKVAEQYAAERSLARAIENLRGGSRTLEVLDGSVSEWLDGMVPDSFLIDPERPLSSDEFVERFMPQRARRRAAPNFVRLALLLICVAGLAIAWRSTPLVTLLDPKELQVSVASITDSPFALIWVVGGYIVGSLVLAPITLLVIATAAAFGPLTGFLYAICGSWVSAVVTYGLGKLVGKETVYRFTGSVLTRVQRQISRHGFLSMLFARIVPIAPFAVVNMVAGACQIRLRDFSLATALGMIPGIA